MSAKNWRNGDTTPNALPGSAPLVSALAKPAPPGATETRAAPSKAQAAPATKSADPVTPAKQSLAPVGPAGLEKRHTTGGFDPSDLDALFSAW